MTKPLALSLKDIHLSFADTVIFEGLSLDLVAQQWTCLLGQSGCGKSTLLRVIAGLQEADSGTISYNQKSVDNKKNIAYMAQDDCLMPWLTVQENVMLGARLRKEQNTKTSEKALTLLETVGLSTHATEMPATLSGGQRQRVALARTLFEDCPIVLMDEPFSKLDAISRYNLQSLAATALKGRTVVLVTHDPQEALRLAHIVLVLSNNLSSKTSNKSSSYSSSDTKNISEFATFDSDIPRELDQPTVASLQQKLWQYLQ